MIGFYMHYLQNNFVLGFLLLLYLFKLQCMQKNFIDLELGNIGERTPLISKNTSNQEPRLQEQISLLDTAFTKYSYIINHPAYFKKLMSTLKKTKSMINPEIKDIHTKIQNTEEYIKERLNENHKKDINDFKNFFIQNDEHFKIIFAEDKKYEIFKMSLNSSAFDESFLQKILSKKLEIQEKIENEIFFNTLKRCFLKCLPKSKQK